MSKILNQLEEGRSISKYTQEFFSKNGLFALLSYSKKELNFEDYIKKSRLEQDNRIRVAKEKTIKDQVNTKIQKNTLDECIQFKEYRIKSKQRPINDDSRDIFIEKQFKLREKYNLDLFIEKKDFPRLMDILRKVDKGNRISEDEFIWLLKNGNNNYRTYFTIELRRRYHKNEAYYHLEEFKKDKNPWSAVNASKHYRKCNKAMQAVALLSSIDVQGIKNRRLQSAIYTTHGGAKRDLKEWDEALRLGEQAHLLNPKSFHPCTLLGAVNILTGNVQTGLVWYDKAVELGYEKESLDDELRGLFSHLDVNIQRELRNHLRSVDDERYDWVDDW